MTSRAKCISGEELHPDLGNFFVAGKQLRPFKLMVNKTTGSEVCGGFFGLSCTTYTAEDVKTALSKLIQKIAIKNGKRCEENATPSGQRDNRKLIDLPTRSMLTHLLSKSGYSFPMMIRYEQVAAALEIWKTSTPEKILEDMRKK